MRFILRSLDVFDEHTAALIAARAALHDDIAEAKEVIDGILDNAEAAHQETLSALQQAEDAGISLDDNDAYEPDMMISSNSFDDEFDREGQSGEQLEAAHAARCDAFDQLESIEEEFERLLTEVFGWLNDVRFRTQAYLKIEPQPFSAGNHMLASSVIPSMLGAFAPDPQRASRKGTNEEPSLSKALEELPELPDGFEWLPLSKLNWDDIPWSAPPEWSTRFISPAVST